MKRKIRDVLDRLKEVAGVGKYLLLKFWNWTKGLLKRKRPKKDFVYPINIPVGGVSEKDITIDPEEGMLIVQTERQIIVEENNPHRVWRRYSSFGFDGAIVLPDGVSMKSVDAIVTREGVRVGWPRDLTDRQRRTISIQ